MSVERVQRRLERSISAEIRPAVVSDEAALIGLSRRTISASYRPFLGDQTVNEFLDGGSADRYVRENLDRCSVLESEGRIVGHAVCQGNLIDLMMIDLDFHRRGFGTELLRALEGALGREYGELRLESFEANQPANAFYRKNGWLERSRYFDRDARAQKIVCRKLAPEASV